MPTPSRSGFRNRSRRVCGCSIDIPCPASDRSSRRAKAPSRANPHYWHKAADGSPLPYLDSIVLTAGRPGEHDFAEAPIRADDYEALKKIEQSGKARLFELGPGLDADALWINPGGSDQGVSRRSGEAANADLSRRSAAGAKADDKPWLTSEAFRLAISAAADRREYCKQVFFGACDPIAGPVTPANASWFNPDMPLGRPDQQLARAMLAELGLRDRSGEGILNDATRRPVRFSLLIRSDVPSSARAATFIANTLKGIGVSSTSFRCRTACSKPGGGRATTKPSTIASRWTTPTRP